MLVSNGGAGGNDRGVGGAGPLGSTVSLPLVDRRDGEPAKLGRGVPSCNPRSGSVRPDEFVDDLVAFLDSQT